MKPFLIGLVLFAQELAVPPLTGRVVDNASVLSAEEEARLTERLEALEKETSVQIVILTIPTLSGESLEDTSMRVAEAWKIGQAGLDNGVLVLAAIEDRRVRIEVGYGLEGVIPDGLAGRIIRERIAPAFREGDYGRGLEAAVEGLALAAKKEYPEAPSRPTGGARRRGWPVGVFVFLFFLLGLFGNATGILAAMVVGGILGWALSGIGLWGFLLGALAGLVAVLFVRAGGSRGGWTSHPSRGGGFGGGGFGGGGFGGGGFSGGGGSFGGGGASGSW